jgi:chorismate synthase
MDPWETEAKEVEARRLHSPRPGHADLVGGIKYDRHDLRDVLERASARETAARVAAGAFAKELLLAFGIEVRSGVLAVGTTGDPWRPVSWSDVEGVDDTSPLRAVDPTLEQQMVEAVDSAKTAGETLGGVVAVVAKGLPIGLGSYVQWNEKLDGRIAQAVMSVHAVKGVSIGDGIMASMQPGSQSHDAIVIEGGRFVRPTNHAGGLEGGVTNGEDLVVRAFMKPIATLRKGLPSVDLDTREAARSQWERSDVTAVPACGVVCEAMLAITLADAMREKFGGDSLGEMKRNFEAWKKQVEQW